MTNNSLQVFKGGWDELENSILTDNKTDFGIISTTFTMSPDGTKVFAIDADLDTVETFPLAIPYDFSTRGSIIDTFPLPFVIPMGIHFKDDGTRMYISSQDVKELHEYIVPIPFTPSSITAPAVVLSLSVLAAVVENFVFSRDGDFVFVVDDVSVYTFPLPIPWDITSNVTNSTVTLPGINPRSLIFKPQGDKMYIIDPGDLREVDLTTPYDVSTFVVNPNILTISNVERDLFLRSNGQELFLLAIFGDSRKLHLDEDWNIFTASHFTNEFPFSIGVAKHGISWKPDGTKFIILDGIGDHMITEFTVPNIWNTDNAVQGALFDIESLDNNVQSMWWRADGLRCYIVGLTVDTLHQLDVATPWDVSTMSDPGINFPLAGIATTTGLYFRADGLKFYILDFSGDDINEYDMSTPFDITTAVLLQSTPVPGTVSGLSGMCFKPDGKMVYFGDLGLDSIMRYTLSIPWDSSTLIFQDKFSVAAQEGVIRAMFIKENDGKKLYVTGDSNTLFSYDMTAEFDFAMIEELGDELVTETGDILVYQ